MNPTAMRMGMPGATAAAPQSGAAGGAVIPALQGKGALAAKLAALKAQGIVPPGASAASSSTQPQAFEGEVGMALAAATDAVAKTGKMKRSASPVADKAKQAGSDASNDLAVAAQPAEQATAKPRSGKTGQKVALGEKSGPAAALNMIDAAKPDPVTGSERPGLERAAATPRTPASPEAAARAEKWKEAVSNPEALRQSGKLQPREARAAELRAEGLSSEEIRDVLRAEGLIGKRDPGEVEAREERAINPGAPARPVRPASETRVEKSARGAMHDARPASEGASEARSSNSTAPVTRDAALAALEAARIRVQEVTAQTNPAATAATPVAPADGASSAPPPVMPVHASAASATSADAPVNFAPLRDAPQASVLAELSARIAARLEAGRRVFDIRLDPPELGSIGVRLEFNGDGQMRAMLAADRVEALELLRRDAPELMRMMREAGIDLAGNGLSFSLEDGRNGAGQHRETHALLREQGFAPVRAALESEIEAALSPFLPTRALDISI